MEQINSTRINRIFLTIALLLVIALSTADASSLSITQVSRNPAVVSSGAEDGTHIFYRLSEPAETTIKIFDARDLLIRDISSHGVQSAGDHQVIWDGRDENGQPVPPNYYTFTVEARVENEETVVYDLTDLTGGKTLTVHQATYDQEQGKINYVLPAPALVNIRIGLPEGGPLLGTLVDWVARPGGRNFESWNGWNSGKVIDITELKNYQIGVSAYELPNNSIIILSKDKLNRPSFIKKPSRPEVHRKIKKQGRKQMYNHWQHSRDKCYDPAIQLSLPHQVERQMDGLPVIEEAVTVSMNVAEHDQLFMYDQRFEVVFYVDFVFVYEEELGYTPFNWQWNPHGVNEGVHYITAMLRGYEGHFGSTTLKVFVKNPLSQKSSTVK